MSFMTRKITFDRLEKIKDFLPDTFSIWERYFETGNEKYLELDNIIHRNRKTVVIAANGPSLNSYNFDLVNLFFVLGLNRGYLKKEMEIDRLVVVNDLVINQFYKEINNLGVKVYTHSDKIKNRIPLFYTADVPSFQTSPLGPVWQGHTVTYVALQIAYWMEPDKVILIGLDHYYPDAEGKPTNYLEFLEEDRSHFTEKYFSGKMWHTPNLERSEVAYKLAKEYFDRVNIPVINATPLSKLEVFPKMTFIEALLY